MSAHLSDKAEEAFKALVGPASAAQGATTYTGKDTATKSLPAVICVADGNGDEDPKGTGNFWVDVSILIKHKAVANESGDNPADDPRADSKALVDAVAGVLQVDTLEADLTAAVANFTVFPGGVIFGAPTSDRDAAGAWIDQLNLKVYCCGSSFPN